ncbi:hypothetical protein A3Q56_00724 [Intoshia linei]|uniref:Uncharacterized protein n=1 Tax=Intoshia linei TaxID=1819745 RepID=A0A177BB26_9BILA|nr:hypothetical protein A3Q56_00724 [Intoshia linei]
MYSIEEEEYDLLSDSKYRMYTSYIDKALKNFEYSSEWADLISAISKIKKIIASYGQYSESIPKLSIIAKRLGQCLHPGLPSGVHLKCLETYELIFSQIKPEILSENLFIFASGLFPVMSYAALNVKSYLLGIYERYFLNLQKSLQQAFPGLLVGLLGGLEEGSQHNKRVLELIEKFCNCVGKRFFYDKLWLCVSNNASIRYNALLYVLAHYNRRLSMDDQIDIMGYYMHNFVSSICYCFSDSNILAQRNAIEFVMNAIPIHSHILLHSDMTKLMASAIKILLRRDISLNRRIFSWFLANSRSEKTSDQTNYFVHNSRDMLVDALTEHMHSCYTLFDLIYERNLGVDEFKKIENQNDFNNSILKCVQLDPKMIDKTLVAFRILSVLINNTIIKDNIMHFMFLRLLEFTFDWVYLNSLFHIDSRCLTFNKLYYKHKYISVETTHSGDWNSSNDSLELNYKENILSEHYKNGRKYISFNKNFQELIDEDGRLKSNLNMTLVCLYCDVWSIDEYKYEFERKDLNGLIRTKKYKTFDEFLIKSNDVSKVLINNFKLILTSVQPKSMIDILINRFNIIMEGLNSCIVSDDEMSFTSSNTINSFSVQHCDDKELVSYLQLNRYCNAIRFLIRMVIQENESNISDNLLCYYMKHTLVMANKCIDKLVVTNIVNLNFLWIAILQKIDCKMDDCNITSSSSLMQFRNLYIKFARNVLSSILKVDANKTRTITQLINQFTGTCYSGEYINDPVTYDVRMVLGTITTLLFDVIFRFFNDDTYINNDDEKGEIIVQEIAKLWTLFLTVSIVHTNPIVYIWSIETLLDFGKFLYNERRDKCLPEKIITLIKDEFDVIFDTNYFSTILKRLWDLLGNTNDVNIVLTIYNVDSINNFKLMDTIILNHLKSELFEDRIQACQIFVNFWNIFLQISEYNENLNIIFITQSIQYMVNILSDVDDVCFSVVESWVLECFRENKISFIIDNLLLVLLNDSTKRYSIFCEEGSEQFKKCFLVDVTKSHLENKSKCQNVEKPFNKDDNEMEKNPIESKIDTPIINTPLAEPENETSPDNIVDMFEFKTFDAYLQNINSIDSGFSEMFFSAPIKKRYLSYLNLDRVACMYNHLLFYYKTPELQNLSKSLKCLESFFDLDAILIVNKFATCPFFDLSEGSTKVLCPILESMISHKCSIILSIFKDISKYSIPSSNTIDSDKITSLNNHICSNLTKLNTHMNYLDILLQTLINFLRSFPREKNLNGFTYENEQFKVRICKILLKIFQGMFTLISNNDNFYPQYYYDILTRNDTQKLLISVYGFYLFQLTNILKNDYKSSNSCILNCKTILKYLVFMFNIFIKIEHYYFNNNPCDEASSEKSGDSKKDISAGVGESLSSYLDCPNMSCLYVIVPIITSKIFVASLLRTFEYFELFSLQVCILDTIIDCLPYFNKQLGSLCTTFLVCIFKNINNHVSKLDEKKIWIISILLKYVKSIFNFFMTESVKFNGNDFQMKNIISYKNYITKFNILKCKETKKVHIINARKQVFKILPSIIFSLVNLWNIYNTNLFKEIQSIYMDYDFFIFIVLIKGSGKLFTLDD